MLKFSLALYSIWNHVYDGWSDENVVCDVLSPFEQTLMLMKHELEFFGYVVQQNVWW